GRALLCEFSVGFIYAVGPRGVDLENLRADEPAGLDGGDRVLRELDAVPDRHDDVRLVVGQLDRRDAADLHPGDLDARAVLETAGRREVRCHGIALASEEVDLPEP